MYGRSEEIKEGQRKIDMAIKLNSATSILVGEVEHILGGTGFISATTCPPTSGGTFVSDGMIKKSLPPP